ncbi:hypothetical protein D3C72_2297110 [compost metagenome]
MPQFRVELAAPPEDASQHQPASLMLRLKAFRLRDQRPLQAGDIGDAGEIQFKRVEANPIQRHEARLLDREPAS